MPALLDVLPLATLAIATFALDPCAADPTVPKRLVLALGLALSLLPRSDRDRPDGVTSAATLLAFLLVGAAATASFPGRIPEALPRIAIALGALLAARRGPGPEVVSGFLAWLVQWVAVASLLELAFPPAWRSAASPEHVAGELVGPLANPNLTASVLVLGLAATRIRFGLPGLMLPCLALAGTLSRAGWVGAAVALLARARSHRTDPSGPVAPGPGAIPAATRGPAPRRLASVLLLTSCAGLGLALSHRFDLGQLVRTRTVAARLALWERLGQAVTERPAVGWGPGGSAVAYGLSLEGRGPAEGLPDRVDHAHQPFLERAVEAGIPGLAASLLLALAILAGIREGLRSPHPGPAAGLAGLLVAESVGVGLESDCGVALAALAAGSLPPVATLAAPGRVPGWTPRLVALALLAFLPSTWRRAGEERTRAEVPRLATHPGRIPRDRFEVVPSSPELRLDTAGLLLDPEAPDLGPRVGRSRARYLLLEASHPGAPAAGSMRRAIRERLGAPRRQGPEPP